MTPLEFVTNSADHYNTPVGAVMEALHKPIRIVSPDGEWEVLSYYYSRVLGVMLLDIQRKKT